MRLRYLLFLFLALVTFIPVAFFGVWPHSRAFDKEIADVSERHLLLARNIGAALERYDRDVKAVFHSLALNLINQNRFDGTAQLFANLGFRHICLADKTNGKILLELSAGGASCPKSVPPARFAIFKEIASAKEVRFTEVLAGPGENPLLYLVQIIGNYIAVGAIETDYIVGLGKAISFGKRGHAAIVDHTGKIIGHPLPKWRRAMKDISALAPVKRMLNKETGVSRFYSPALKGKMVAGFTWVPGSNWGVMIPQPIAELRARADGVQRYTLGVIVVGFIAAALAAWFLSGYLTRPVFAVVEAARKMTEGDHGARVAPVGGAAPGEFMMLQQSFNNMADALEKSDREQATALAEAEAANHSKTRFLANMSHELRTPLNAIIGFSDLIANRRFGPNLDERYREYAHDILSSGNHLLSLIEDILDMSKIESGEFEPEESDVDISEEIAYSVSFIEGPAREKNIELRRDIPEGIPLLRADRRMARQILINLLSNAVKFTRPGGIVRVNVHLDESSSLGLVVADNGVGIPEADLSVITGAFKQADNHLKQDQRGTGLGLAIARSLVEAHEGTLGITSEVGKGTTVTVKFPPERTIRTG